jgi:cytochrome c biogenesis protein CcmG/thiol:disulfide interchange protein DsbE
VVVVVAIALLVPALLLGWRLTTGGGGADTPSAPAGGIDIGSTAPDFKLQRLDGGDLRLSDLRGHPVVLTFFASWCIPCGEEVPLLQDALHEHPGQLEVVGVLYGDAESDARSFLADHGATFPALLDPGFAVSQGAYGVNAIPVTFFVDADGRVVDRAFGITSRAALDEPLSRLLAAS